MVQIMGGSVDSVYFTAFQELCVRGFLAIRPYREEIVTLVNLMKDCGMPCFKPTSILNLRSRFVPEKDERSAASFISTKILEAYDRLSTMTTAVYDTYQKLAEGIAC